MKPLPPSHVVQEKRREIEQSKAHVAWLVGQYLQSGQALTLHFIGWWEDYIKRREKELEDEQEA